MDSKERAFMEIAAGVMRDTQPLPVTISIAECWLLISGLQLCCRHPGLSASMLRDLENIGRQFQEAIVATHPEAADLIEMGWHDNFDVPQ